MQSIEEQVRERERRLDEGLADYQRWKLRMSILRKLYPPGWGAKEKAQSPPPVSREGP